MITITWSFSTRDTLTISHPFNHTLVDVRVFAAAFHLFLALHTSTRIWACYNSDCCHVSERLSFIEGKHSTTTCWSHERPVLSQLGVLYRIACCGSISVVSLPYGSGLGDHLPIVICLNGPKQLCNLFNRLHPCYVGAVWIEMQQNECWNQHERCSLFPRENLLSFLVCGDHEMGARAFLLADREEQTTAII